VRIKTEAYLVAIYGVTDVEPPVRRKETTRKTKKYVGRQHYDGS
jgi:hypothetical protein